MEIFAFRQTGETPTDPEANMGMLVLADSQERAAEMIADPALVAMCAISAEAQPKLAFDMVLNERQAQMVLALELPVLTEYKLMVAKTSVAAVKDDATKLFKCGEGGCYTIAAKDRDDALKLIDAIAQRYQDETGLRDRLRTSLAEQETPKTEYEGKRIPRIVNWQMIEWERQKAAEKAAEPIMMPMPSQVM